MAHCDTCLQPSACSETGQCGEFARTINPAPVLALTEDSADRKDTPMARGLLDYFPAALAYVSTVSAYGNRKHNPDSDSLVWTRGKSNDHADCIVRHLIDRGLEDGDGIRHSGYVAWRALALLQEELEAEGAAPGRAAVMPTVSEPPMPACLSCPTEERDGYCESRGCVPVPVDDEPVGAGVSKPQPICVYGGEPCPVPGGCRIPCKGDA